MLKNLSAALGRHQQVIHIDAWDQLLHSCYVAVLACAKQGGAVLGVLCTSINAVVEQKLHHLHLASGSRIAQWSGCTAAAVGVPCGIPH